ncbi:MAG: PAS domain-containing protein [Chloroflexota bacterium]|nr:PAS domain-containing protein [Chloroflexota bacterium]
MAQQEIELILARQLASSLAVPVLLVDARGDTLYYNEPAEAIFGRSFDELDALPFEERSAILAPLDLDGRPLPPDDLPGMVAMRQRRPAHGTLRICGLDGIQRPVEATGLPLESAGGRLLGAMVILWRADSLPEARRGEPGERGGAAEGVPPLEAAADRAGSREGV